MNKKQIVKYMNIHPNANRSALQALDISSLKYKILKEFSIDTRVTKNMSKNSLVNLYRNLYIKNLKEIKYGK